MKEMKEDYYQTYQELQEKTNPEGAFLGALIGAIPAFAFYALIVNFGPLPYLFILVLLSIPALMIALAARFSGSIYLAKHRFIVVVIACLLHIVCVEYFHIITEAYYIFPIIIIVTFMVSKMSLSKEQSIVVDMEAEGRFENQ